MGTTVACLGVGETGPAVLLSGDLTRISPIVRFDGGIDDRIRIHCTCSSWATAASSPSADARR
jgi:hypothetical protein